MKTYKIIIACAASLFLGACSNELDEDVTLGVNIDTNENVSFDGHIITVKKPSSAAKKAANTNTGNAS